MNPTDFHQKAVARFTELQDTVHWFPCGFVTVQAKGARGKQSKELKELGFKKDEYMGGMYLSMSKFTPKQSLELKRMVAEELMTDLKEAYPGVRFFLNERLD